MPYPMAYNFVITSIVPEPLFCFFVPRSLHHPYTHRFSCALVLTAFVVDIIISRLHILQ
ncbi:hypothetical protein EDD22DRAFT_898971 [Suillus occidentalis]|nr:hypothetical protein EDD22DRAFT_898971 [Suillus occidentalis]